MSWFNNLKIGTKLLVSFLICATIAAVIGFVGYNGLNAINKNSDSMYHNNLIPISKIGLIMEIFQKTRVEVRDIIMASDPALINQDILHIKEMRQEINVLCKEAEKGIVDEKEKNIYEEVSKARTEFREEMDKVIGLAQNNQDAEALVILHSTAQATNEAYENALKKWLGYNTTQAETAQNTNKESASSASTFLIIMVVVGFAISLLFGFFISQNIRKPVSRMLWMAEEMQKGLIHNTRSGITSKDEIGQMAAKLDSFAETLDVSVLGSFRKIASGDVNFQVKAASEKDEIGPVVNELAQTMQSLVKEINTLIIESAEGNLKKRGNANQFKGSYSELVAGINKMLDEILNPIMEGSQALEKMAAGNLSVKVTGNYKGDHQIIKNSINNLGESMCTALSEVNDAAQASSSAATEISSSTEQMAAGAEEQSQQTSEVATSVEQMTRTILDTSKNAALATEASKKAGQIARDGGEAVKNTILGMNRIAEVVERSAETVQKLGKSSSQIGEIVQVIDDIADQTNLLALNAAIEAARAGEQGRGFAVVADEVRKLAERTTKATKEIAQMIKQIQVETQGAVSAMNEGKIEVEKGKHLADQSGSSLKDIITGTEKVVDIIMQVAAASEEQSAASEQISKSVEGISSVTQENSAGVQQIARAAEDLSRLTTNLEKLVSQFKLGDTITRKHPEKSNIGVRANGKVVHV